VQREEENNILTANYGPTETVGARAFPHLSFPDSVC